LGTEEIFTCGGVADDAAGAGIVEVLVFGGEDARRRPVLEVGGGTGGEIPVDEVVFFFADVGVVEAEEVVVAVVDEEWVAIGGAGVALEEEGGGECVEEGRGRGGCGSGVRVWVGWEKWER